MVLKAEKKIKEYQRDVSRGSDGKYRIDVDTGERRGNGKKKDVVWNTVKEGKVLYEVRPKYSIGDTFVHDNGYATAVITECFPEPGFNGIKYELEHTTEWKRKQKIKEIDLILNWSKR